MGQFSILSATGKKKAKKLGGAGGKGVETWIGNNVNGC